MSKNNLTACKNVMNAKVCNPVAIGVGKKVDSREKYFYAVDNDFCTSSNKVPEEYMDKIICDDSTKFLQKLPDNCIDLVLTSPPYNFCRNYDLHADENDWNAYFQILYSVLLQCIRVLKFGGRLVINIQPAFVNGKS